MHFSGKEMVVVMIQWNLVKDCLKFESLLRGNNSTGTTFYLCLVPHSDLFEIPARKSSCCAVTMDGIGQHYLVAVGTRDYTKVLP